MKLQEMAPIKCRCSGGSILLVHFSGKVLDLVVWGAAGGWSSFSSYLFLVNRLKRKA